MDLHKVKVNSLPCTSILSLQSSTIVSTSTTPKKTIPKNAGTEEALEPTLQLKVQKEAENINRDCDSPASCYSGLEMEFSEFTNYNNGSITASGSTGKSNGSLSAASSNSVSAAPLATNALGSGETNGSASVTSSLGVSSVIASTHIKKRISSNRTPTRKAHRIKFYRNGDRFYPGITIPVSNERYRSFESLFEDLTRLLEENVKIPGAVRAIYNMYGKKVGIP